MEIIGRKFKAGELFIPEVLLSARALNQGLAVLEPHLSGGRRAASAKVLIGTVRGELGRLVEHAVRRKEMSEVGKPAGFHDGSGQIDYGSGHAIML
jgi:methanogenic corrinoid protein MtbC1